jgi:DNA-binding PadR family transcriptional regulator
MAQVVRVLLENPGERQYGFKLMRSLKLSSGTLYPILARLSAAGWVERRSEGQDPKVIGRPARTYYVLTAEAEPVAVRALYRMRSHYDVHAEVARRVHVPGMADSRS